VAIEGMVVQPGDAEHGVVDAVAIEAAVATDLPGVHADADMPGAGEDLAVRASVFLLAGQQFRLAAFSAVRDDQAGTPVTASAITVVRPTAAFAADSSHALQSLRLPDRGRPTATTSRVPASMTTRWWADYR
jgi:hypothetical protein